MTFIPEARLNSVEPITRIVGMTGNGDMLIEDRNGVRYGLPWQIVEAARAQVIAPIFSEPAPPVVDETIVPEPKKARKRK